MLKAAAVGRLADLVHPLVLLDDLSERVTREEHLVYLELLEAIVVAWFLAFIPRAPRTAIDSALCVLGCIHPVHEQLSALILYVFLLGAVLQAELLADVFLNPNFKVLEEGLCSALPYHIVLKE